MATLMGLLGQPKDNGGVPKPPNTGSISTRDGVKLVWERFGTVGPKLVLIHGWSASRHYWDLNTRALARASVVYTYDQRFHGESDKPCWGYHIARLAADLHDLLTQLDLTEVTVVGASMGCAVIWSYIELFGEERLSQAVFIDQAPLQNLADEWRLGSKGCFDVASLTRLQCKLQFDFDGFARDNVAFCTTLPISSEVAGVLVQQTLKADRKALAQLMADHTQLDWRPLLPRITLPCLNIVGRKSSVFPWEGCEVVGKLVRNCHTVYFEEANHWLYIEESDKFNSLLLDFLREGFFGVRNKVRL